MNSFEKRCTTSLIPPDSLQLVVPRQSCQGHQPDGPPRGPALRPADRVRLVSPSSAPTASWLEESIDILTAWGLQPEVGDHALDQRGFTAGPDDDRLADLNDAFRTAVLRAQPPGRACSTC